MAKKKNIRISWKKRENLMLDSSNVVVVFHTTEGETLFPEKLAKMNEMLSRTKFLDS